MLIAYELRAVLSRDKLNARILGMFADGMTDYEIVAALSAITLADVVKALYTSYRPARAARCDRTRDP